MTEIEKYLAVNTIACAPLHARISRAQCGLTIKSGDVGHCAECPEAAKADMSGPGPVTAWGRPRLSKPQKLPVKTPTENPMQKQQEQQEQGYTMSDIAARAGVKPECMYAAMKYIKRGITSQSQNATRVQEALDALGITWRDIKNVRGKGAVATVAPPEPPTLPVPQAPQTHSPVLLAPVPAALKHDTGKLRLDLIPPEITRALGDVFTFGATKYGDRNWEAGLAPDRLYAALQRHLLAWREGEGTDQESGLPHLAHALTTLGMLLTLEKRA